MSASDLREPDEDAAPRRSLPFASIITLVLIGGTLVALVGPTMPIRFGHLGGEVNVAEQTMANFEAAIDSYRMVHKRLPASLKALTETPEGRPHPMMKRIPLDPWGNAYKYRLIGERDFEIRSCGEDGVADTEDDLTWPPDDLG